METPQRKAILTGDKADATAALLRERLAKLGGVALCVLAGMPAEPSTFCADNAYVLHDTPAFVVKKILDELANYGWITRDAGTFSPEEEQIRARLQGLGYVD